MTLDSIDWPLVLNVIRSRYKPLSQVADEVGAGAKHLQNLARGEVKEPKFLVGVKLLDIYEDVK